MQAMIDNFQTKYMSAIMNVIDGVVVFVVGWYLIKLFIYILMKMLKKTTLDSIIINFIRSILITSLRIVLIITTLSTIGVPTTSLVAILTTAGAAVALGLQDSLKGFVSGMVILFAKPFVKGDIIEINQYIGKIQEIQLLYTILMTFDNKMVVIPNNQLASQTFVNYSHEDIRRVDMSIDVHYQSDIALVKRVIYQVIEQHTYSLKEPLPYIRVSEYKEHAIEITIRVWTKTEHYYDLRDDLIEQIKQAFDKNNISIPYPQIDVHIS